jgi:hypothetical protein
MEEDRTELLRRRIALYRRYLREGANGVFAAEYLRQIDVSAPTSRSRRHANRSKPSARARSWSARCKSYLSWLARPLSMSATPRKCSALDWGVSSSTALTTFRPAPHSINVYGNPGVRETVAKSCQASGWAEQSISRLLIRSAAERVTATGGIVSGTPHPLFDLLSITQMGQVIRVDNIDDIKFPVICGCANNQLETDELAQILHNRGLLYCPDFLVNAGGVISAASEITGYDEQAVRQNVIDRGGCLTTTFKMAEQEKTTPLEMAKLLANLRLAH